MINLVEDSEGNVYSIMAQAQLMSCTIACTWMARNLAMQRTSAEDEWGLAQNYYRNAVAKALAPLGVDVNAPACLAENTGARGTMANRLSTEGFYHDEIVRALKAEGLKVDVVQKGTGPLVLARGKLGEGKPAMVVVGWLGGGSHAIVAARHLKDGRIVYLDPWGGHLTEQANAGSYTAPNGLFGAVQTVMYLSGKK